MVCCRVLKTVFWEALFHGFESKPFSQADCKNFCPATTVIFTVKFK